MKIYSIIIFLACSAWCSDIRIHYSHHRKSIIVFDTDSSNYFIVIGDKIEFDSIQQKEIEKTNLSGQNLKDLNKIIEISTTLKNPSCSQIGLYDGPIITIKIDSTSLVLTDGCLGTTVKESKSIKLLFTTTYELLKRIGGIIKKYTLLRKLKD